MISLVLNAWAFMRLRGMPTSTRVLFLDGAGVTQVEPLFARVLSPARPLLYGNEEPFRSRSTCFASLTLAPPEASGPLMTHLNDAQLCGRAALVLHFVSFVVSAFGVDGVGADSYHGGGADVKVIGSLSVTFVSRTDYANRSIARQLVNEAELASAWAQLGHFRVRRAQFELLPFDAQLRLVRDTDVLVGMHGAGMVNSLWLPRSAHVIEIFPASKRRWGYRNICQYTGCRYTQFRGGVDLPLEAKHVAAEEWIAFLRGWLLQAGLQEFLREP